MSKSLAKWEEQSQERIKFALFVSEFQNEMLKPKKSSGFWNSQQNRRAFLDEIAQKFDIRVTFRGGIK